MASRVQNYLYTNLYSNAVTSRLIVLISILTSLVTHLNCSIKQRRPTHWRKSDEKLGGGTTTLLVVQNLKV